MPPPCNIVHLKSLAYVKMKRCWQIGRECVLHLNCAHIYLFHHSNCVSLDEQDRKVYKSTSKSSRVHLIKLGFPSFNVIVPFAATVFFLLLDWTIYYTYLVRMSYFIETLPNFVLALRRPPPWQFVNKLSNLLPSSQQYINL